MVAPLASPTTPQTRILAATRRDDGLAGASLRCGDLQGSEHCCVAAPCAAPARPPSRACDFVRQVLWAVGPVLFLLLGLAAFPGHAAQLALSLGSIRHPAFEADGVVVEVDTWARDEADIRIGRLRVGASEYRELKLHCSGFAFDGGKLDCPQGTLRRDDARGKDRPALPFSFRWDAAERRVEFALKEADVVTLSPLVKRLRGWQPQGTVDFRIAVDAKRARLNLALKGVGFADKSGEIAGKDIDLTLDVEATRRASGWAWHAALDWPRGELRRAPWTRAAGVRLTGEGTFDAAEFAVANARVEVDGVGALNAALRWDREQERTSAWGFVTEPLDLATAMREWGQPWLARFGVKEVRASGRALFSAESKQGRLQRFYAGLEDATVEDATGALELRGVAARIPWEADAETEAEVGVDGGRLGDVPIGAFKLPLRLAGEDVRIDGLRAPMLDGRLEIENLHLRRGTDGWHGEFSGGVDGVSMNKLSRALGLPAMAGTVTTRIPRVTYGGGTLALDGALAIEVFDGGILVHKLRLVDAFEANRRLVADVTARNLDLGLLTRTFSFGAVEGRFDADLRDLEMQGWTPLRFDARIASSLGEYPKRMSFGALEDIAALGETGDAGKKTVERLPRRDGSTLGYARIGVSASLRQGVVTLDGIASDGDGFVIMEPAGIPAVRIIGYNRRIDWEALVARVREVIAGRPGMLIE